MLNWLHKLLNPHCPDCKNEQEDELVCPSCESLKGEIEHLRYQNKRLLDNLLIKPEPEIHREPVPITRPKSVPWPVRKAMLESEDREKAARLRSEAKAQAGAAKPDSTPVTTPTIPPVDTEDLEREMGLVQQERENGA